MTSFEIVEVLDKIVGCFWFVKCEIRDCRSANVDNSAAKKDARALERCFPHNNTDITGILLATKLNASLRSDAFELYNSLPTSIGDVICTLTDSL